MAGPCETTDKRTTSRHRGRHEGRCKAGVLTGHGNSGTLRYNRQAGSRQTQRQALGKVAGWCGDGSWEWRDPVKPQASGKQAGTEAGMKAGKVLVW